MGGVYWVMIGGNFIITCGSIQYVGFAEKSLQMALHRCTVAVSFMVFHTIKKISISIYIDIEFNFDIFEYEKMNCNGATLQRCNGFVGTKKI